MKKFILSIMMVAAVVFTAAAQPPQRFNYQGIARNGQSEPLASKQLGMRISIRNASPNGVIVYQETHTPTTNEFGLYNISIGDGTPVVGTFAAVTWDSGEKYVQVEIDINGGTTYADLGARQLLSVPYALLAGKASPPTLTISGNTLSAGGNSVEIPGASGTTNFISKFNTPSTLGNSQLFDDGTSVGIGVTPLSATTKFQVNGLAITAISGNSIGGSSTGVQGTTSGAGNGISGLVTSGGLGAAGFFDGGTAGKGLLIPRGAVGINNNTPINRLWVIGGTGTGMDTNATIFGIANTTAAARKGGVVGTYDPVLAGGIGVQGFGRDGYSHRSAVDSFFLLGLAANNHIGLYGSAQQFGVLGTARAGYGVFGAVKGGTGVFGVCQGGTGDGVSGLGWATGVRGTTGYALPAGVPAPPTPAESYGVYGSGGIGTIRYGVYGIGNGTNGVQSIGLAGYATSGSVTTASTHYGVFGTATNGATNWAGYFLGNVNITGSIAKGSGTFKIDHPLDPENKILYHSFVESPDMMNIYNGNITTDANGFARVTMPNYFDALNKDFRYQLTVIGTFAQAIVKEKMNGNTFLIQTNVPNVEVSWQVTGVRNDKYANTHRVVPEVEKNDSEKGKYIHPEEWGKPAAAGIDYDLMHKRPVDDAAMPGTATAD